MDFRHVIETTRETTRQAQASYSNANWKADRLKKPLMFYIIRDRRFEAQFRDHRILLERGAVVWGAIIQANEILFQENGPCASLPAAIIYSAGDGYDTDPELLIEHAHNMYDLKGRECSPKMQAFADKLANEIVADIKLPIPRGFTDGAQCYYATRMIARKHLPSNYLANGFFPILIAPDQTNAVMVLPQAYWNQQFKMAWSGG